MGRYFNDFVNDQNLSHHGILGMSWGKKNGPPYPLDGSDHSSAEKKAGWRKSLDKSTQKGRNRSGVTTEKYTLNKAKNSSGVTSYKVNTAKNKSGVTSERYTINKGANNRGLSTKSAYSTVNNTKIANQIAQDNVNCALCTYVMDLRERGIDVRANSKIDWAMTSGDGNTSTESIAKWYKDPKTGETPQFHEFSQLYKSSGRPSTLKSGNDNIRRNNDIKLEIKKQGDGTYGHLIMENMITDRSFKHYGYSMGGHDVFYKVENGKVIIYDGQIGKRMPFDEYMKTNSADGVTMYVTDYLRTDNLEFSNSTSTNGIAIDTNTAKYNYSPGYNTEERKIIQYNPSYKETSNYNPPYKSENREVKQYNPPYETAKGKKAVNKVLETAKKVSNKVSTKAVSAVTKALTKLNSTLKRSTK